MAASAPRRWWSKAALCGAVALGSALAADLAVGLARGYDAKAAGERLAALEHPLETLVNATNEGEQRKRGPAGPPPDAHVLQPYTGFDLYGGLTAFRIDYERYRALAAGAPKRSFDVMILGGSVAIGFAHVDNGGGRLAKALDGQPELGGRTLRALAYARPGFRQPQQLCQLAWLLSAGFKPDLVLNLDGFNEVALSSVNAAHEAFPLYPSWAHYAHLLSNPLGRPRAVEQLVEIARWDELCKARAHSALAFGLQHSALLGPWALGRSEYARARASELQGEFEAGLAAGGPDAAAVGIGFQGTREQAVEAGVRCWLESSRSLRALCAGRGIRYVHALQPTLHDAGSKPVTEQERSTGTIDPDWLVGVQQGYPLLRAACAELRAEGEICVDLTQAFAEVHETLYVDSCHMNAQGNWIMADALAPVILAALRAP